MVVTLSKDILTRKREDQKIHKNDELMDAKD